MTVDRSNKVPDYAQAREVDQSVIPVIDLAKRHAPETRHGLAQQLVKTAEASGFFYVSNTAISGDYGQAAFQAPGRFLAFEEG